jgi:hypothetical protein
MFTREEIVEYSVRMGCNKDLKNKGMVTTPYFSVFCLATLSGDYPDLIYYKNGQKSPRDVYYCGVYGVRSCHRLDPSKYETMKNVVVTKTDGIEKFVYFFEKTDYSSKLYFFHGRYKYICHEMIQSNNDEHKEEILFHLEFVDRPHLK